MSVYFRAKATFTMLLLTMSMQSLYGESNVTYFAPTHPDACSEKKTVQTPIIIPEPKVEITSPPPPPIIQKESDRDNDGIVDSNDQCPDTPKGYKVDSKGCPSSVTLHLNFASNSSILPASAESDIATLTKFMEENPAATMSIIGHTDSSGPKAKNQTLSENRANALGSRLIQNSIASDRIKISGKGSSEPIVSNKTPDGRAQNRRIQILIR